MPIPADILVDIKSLLYSHDIIRIKCPIAYLQAWVTFLVSPLFSHSLVSPPLLHLWVYAIKIISDSTLKFTENSAL